MFHPSIPKAARVQHVGKEELMNCTDVMTPAPVCCEPGDEITDAARLMKTGNVGALPVVKDRRGWLLAGMITDRDIAVRVVAEGRDPAQTTVGEVMSPEPVTCASDDLYQEALQAMAVHQLRRMPVVDPTGRLVGIIAQADIATRVSQPSTTGALVEAISEPAISASPR